MTSEKDIQSLISDIDSLLPQADSSFLSSEPRDVDNLYQVLVKYRSFLVYLISHNSVATPENPATPVQQQHQETGEQVLQVVTQQMNCLRADLLTHLQTDLEALRQQRESLVREIQQLEETHRQLNLLDEQKTLQQQQLISEFSQKLINRCSVNLSYKLAQILGNWEGRLLSDTSLTPIRIPTSTNKSGVEGLSLSGETSEQLGQIQKNSDQMLSNLDANQRLVFEALQSNLESYQQSLSQSMAKMHNLGSQVEVLFTEFFERLIKQLLPSDVLLPTNQMATSQPDYQTLLPNNDLSMREQQRADLTLGLILEPNSLLGSQMSLQLPPPESQIDPVARNQIAGKDDKEISASPPNQPGFLTDSLDSGTLNSQKLDIEELYWENLGIELDNNDEINTLIQLDIDEQEEVLSEYSLLSLPEERHIPSSLESQAPDASRHHQEIDDLYATLFGTDALSTTVGLDESDSPPPSSDSSLDETTLGESEGAPDGVSGATSEVSKLGVVNLALLEKFVADTSTEDVLFEGFGDPAAEVNQPPTQELSLGHPEESWEVLFFEDSATELPREDNLAQPPQTFSSTTNSVTTQESAGVESITKLTDLLEQMGLNDAALPGITDEALAEELSNTDLPASVLSPNTQIKSQYPTAEAETQSSLAEEPYIPASKDEILLAEDELDSASDREIVLDPNTMQQLSEDLDHFEEDKTQALPTQEEESSTTATTENLANQQPPRFRRSEELLAEDWEELSLQDEGEGIKVVRDETSFNLSTSEASELIESNFDSDLFPPEIPDLDQLNLVNNVGIDSTTSETEGSDDSNTYPIEEVVESSLVPDEDSTNIPEDLLPIDDETFTEIFIEMLHEQPQPDSDVSPDEEG